MRKLASSRGGGGDGMMRLQALIGAATALAMWPASAQAPDPVAAILGEAPGCHAAALADGGDDAPPASAPGLFPHLGVSGYAVERVAGGEDGEAGRYFTQGILLTHAFNAPEAIRALRWARAKDPDCAMCAWGEGWARGPTINYPVEGEDAAKARKAALDADRLAALPANAQLSPKARGLIAAEIARFPLRGAKAVTDDKAYARAMEALSARFPDDDAIAVEAASALMIAAHYNWKPAATDPKSTAGRARTLIERVLARSPDFPPALHFHIHLMEGAGLAKLAEASADRLGKDAPGAGHLVHMPSHIFYRLGRFEDAAVSNARASADDARYVAELKPPGGLREFALHGHNVSFGLGGALMSGDGPGALAFARQAQTTFKPDSFLYARGYLAYARYGDEATVAALPKPSAPIIEIFWRYARGEQAARRGDLPALDAETSALAAAQGPAHASKDFKHADPYLEIARLTLVGRAAMLRRNWPAAIAALSRAADLRDKADDWPDPPGWGFPPRRTLAAARLLSGDAAGAERELGKALAFEPNDPLALYVLGKAREKTGDADAERYEAAAKRLWRGPPGTMTLEGV